MSYITIKIYKKGVRFILFIHFQVKISNQNYQYSFLHIHRLTIVQFILATQLYNNGNDIITQDIILKIDVAIFFT